MKKKKEKKKRKKQEEEGGRRRRKKEKEEVKMRQVGMQAVSVQRQTSAEAKVGVKVVSVTPDESGTAAELCQMSTAKGEGNVLKMTKSGSDLGPALSP